MMLGVARLVILGNLDRVWGRPYQWRSYGSILRAIIGSALLAFSDVRRMINPRTTLQQLHKNLATLEERRAKYAGNAPLDLLNQIDDHHTAITLTKQRLANELSEVEWSEALKPLLLAVREGQVVNIEAETYIAGDAVAGDKISGGVKVSDAHIGVLGDNAHVEGGIHFNIFQAPVQTTPPSPVIDAQERRNLGILLHKVKSFWVEGVLEKSIHAEVMLELGKQMDTEAVDHPWGRILELPHRESQNIPVGIKISALFAEMERAMLILGEPGSGKTITLLELARELIQTLETDESFSQPVPVIFNLSSWQKDLPLLDWLESELSAKYQIPKKIGRTWLETHRLLPLLDGLDEVRTENRAPCVEAINTFYDEYGLAGLVVCSRLAEYTALPVRLKLNGAIQLQPLTMEQVDRFLTQAGPQLSSLREILQQDKPLRELVQSPLMLNIMSFAYQEGSALSHRVMDSVEACRKLLFEEYIKKMLGWKGRREKPYNNEQIMQWVAGLAQELTYHDQTIFLIEQLQPSWLYNRLQYWSYITISRLVGGLIFVLPFFVERLIRNPSNVPILGATLSSGLISGLVMGLIDGLNFQRRYHSTNGWLQRRLSHVCFSILMGGLIFWGIFGLIFYVGIGTVIGLPFGLFFGLIFGLRGSTRVATHDIQTVEDLGWSWSSGLTWAVRGFGGGATFGLGLGLILGWALEMDNILRLALILGGVEGLVGGVVGATFGGLRSKIVEMKSVPNQGIRLSIKNAVIGGCIGGLSGALIGGTIGGFRVGLIFGLNGAAMAGLWYGILDIIQHYILRFILYLTGHLPWNLTRFLDHCTDLIFLRKVGGGYIFIHRLLLEHFAAMAEETDGSS